MKIDSRLVMGTISIPTGKTLDFLNLAVEAFTQCIGYSMSGIGYNVVHMRLEALGGFDNRSQA